MLFSFFTFYGFMEWFEAFLKTGFQIIPTSLRSIKNMKNRNPIVFPQNSGLFCLVAHLPGPSQYRNNNLDSPFHLVTCSNTRSMDAMFNVQHTNSKLCEPKNRVPFFKRELPHEMLGELIYLLYP